MATCHKEYLTCKIHLDVKNPMTSNECVADRWLLILFQDVEGRLYVPVFPIDGVAPQGGTGACGNSQSSLDRFGKRYSVLMCTSPIPRKDFRDDPVSSMECLRHPPIKSWYRSQFVGYGILG